VTAATSGSESLAGTGALLFFFFCALDFGLGSRFLPLWSRVLAGPMGPSRIAEDSGYWRTMQHNLKKSTTTMPGLMRIAMWVSSSLQLSAAFSG